MHFPSTHSKPIRYIVVIISLLMICRPLQGHAQERKANRDCLLPSYLQLKTDKERMQSLVNTINDSLFNDNLVHVYDWASIGLQIAKENHVDSLTGSFLLYMGKAYNYYYENKDSAIYYYKQSIPWFHYPFNNDRIIAVRSIMDCYGDLGQKDSAYKYLDISLTTMNELPDTSFAKYRLAEVIGDNYSWFGMYKSAIHLFDIAKQGYLKLNKQQSVGMVLSHLALIFDELEDDAKAISYWKESLPYLTETRWPYATNCHNIASSYADLGLPDSSWKYLGISDSIAKQIDKSSLLASNKRVTGVLLTIEHKYDQARQVLTGCLSDFEQNENPRDLIMTLFDLSNLDSARHDFNAAKMHLQKALDISRQTGMAAMEYKALKGLSSLSFITDDYKEAYTLLAQSIDLNDSLTKERTMTELADFEIVYKTQQKEQEIQLLKRDNALNKLQLKNSRQLIYFSIGAFILLIVLGIILFYHRSRRIKLEAQKMKAELQTQLLRSQMNPHFIFNSLNSIENFIMQNDKRKASDYLNKFSNLIRNILDSSRNETVPLSKDIETLALYVELEQLRFNQKFEYHTHIDPALLEGDYRVPPLLMQPYLENAIIHGLAHSEKKNLSLAISAVLENDKIKFTIQDNGIGRKQASVYNMQNKPWHKSVGLKITEERIHLFNNDTGDNMVIIKDLFDSSQNPQGTQVEVTLKAV